MSAGIGQAGAQKENVNGQFLKEAVRTANLVLASTLSESGSGPTWVSGHAGAKGQRLDYVGVGRRAAQHILKTWPMEEIDLATSNRKDHTAVACDLHLENEPWIPTDFLENNDVREKRKGKFAAHSLKNPRHKARFETELAKGWPEIERMGREAWKLEDSGPLGLDARTAAWTLLMTEAADKSFERDAQKKPKKRWITEWTWSVVRQIAPERRRIVRTRQLQQRMALRFLFLAWSGLSYQAIVPVRPHLSMT